MVVPPFMEEVLAELTHLARRSPEISQRSGVSVRVSVANTEVLEAAALKRAVRLGEPLAAPRVSDLGAVVATTVGKVELESIGDRAAARTSGASRTSSITCSRPSRETSRLRRS